MNDACVHMFYVCIHTYFIYTHTYNELHAHLYIAVAVIIINIFVFPVYVCMYVCVTSLPWPYRQMYSCIRQKGGRTSSKSPRRLGSEYLNVKLDNHRQP